MKNIKTSSWIFWVLLAFLSLSLWFQLSYPNLSIIDLSVRRSQALRIADDYLHRLGFDPGSFQKAVIFSANYEADRFFQKNLGFDQERKLLKQEKFDLFYWKVRFFKENDKEEFRLIISSENGTIISFLHTIPDTDKRDIIDENQAREKLIKFLQEKFSFSPDLYSLHSSQSQKYDNRIDHTFIWRKNDINILWKDRPQAGSAKLLIGGTVSGEEILYFFKDEVDIPDEFVRHIEQQKQTGQNFSILFRLFYIVIIAASTFVVVTRRQHLAMQAVKRFYIRVTIVLFALNVLYNLSEFQSILYYYKTSSSLASYWLQCLFSLLNQIFFLTLSIIMPGLGGEVLRNELEPDKKEASLSFYIRTSFWTRGIFPKIVLGYLIAGILIGLQAVLFHLGNRYMGVWIEQSWMTQLSSSYFPFLAAFVLALQAGFVEEVTFRIFGIYWGKKLLKSAGLAVIVSSVVWGFGHTQYLIFPMWFRGIEVSIIGMFLGFIYLRYGIITVLVAHYLFDAFWGTAAFILGHANWLDFLGSISVLSVPLIFGLVAFVKNQKEDDKNFQWTLNKHQEFNLKVLQNFLAQPDYQKKTDQEINRELAEHGWDSILIETALKNRKN